MVKSFMLCVAGLLTAHSSNAEATKMLPVLVGGRALVDNNNHNKYTYSWPGVYFESRFVGDEVDVHLSDANNMLNIVIDDKEPVVLNKPGDSVYSLKNLGDGVHTIRLEKRTETISGTGSFEGFFIPETQMAISPVEPKRKIEFIGDSITVGYGNTSITPECSNDEIFSKTNTQVAFSALVAKHFNAQYQINAVSGMGVVRNYNGNNVNTSLLAKYPFTLNDQHKIYRDRWTPQIIVITLGANDFNTALNNNERWKTRKQLQNNFVLEYQKFVLSLRKKHSKATIILVSADDQNSELTTQIKRVVALLKKHGAQHILFKATTVSFQKAGCQFHPSAQDHMAAANLFIDYIEKNPSLWNESVAASRK